jgi:hypothetical protein
MAGDSSPRAVPAAALAVVACTAALLLYLPFILRPSLFQDDFLILAQSWTWQETRQALSVERVRDLLAWP